MFEEDLSVFFDEKFVHQRLGRIFEGIFERDYVETNEISGMAPVITCATSDAEGFKRDDIIERSGELYKFIYEEPDGTGVSRLILEAA